MYQVQKKLTYFETPSASSPTKTEESKTNKEGMPLAQNACSKMFINRN